jgi:hypothetical protein
MTQDPWDQPRPAGYVVRGEVVPDAESGADQAPPMTHFQKVASALRADQPEQPASQEEDQARTEEVRAVSSPDAGRDYWDEDEDGPEDGPAGDPAAAPAEDAVSASAPAAEPEAAPSAPPGQAEEEPGSQAGQEARDAADPSITQPDVFGTAGPAATPVPTVPIALAEEPDGAAGRHAAPAMPSAPAAPAAPAEEAELRPGESGTTLGFGESGYASLLTDTGDLRAQWHRIQYMFVDDPRASVTEAADVLAQVAARLEAAIAERQRGLRGRWDTGTAADTETLRETLRMYRSFLDQLIGPEPS